MRSARTRLTREQILAIGPIVGAEGEGGGAAGGSGSNPPGDGGSGTGKNDEGKDDKTGVTGKSDDPLEGLTPEQVRRKLLNSLEAGDRLAAKLKDAEGQRDELSKAQEERDRKERTELENASKDLEKATERNALLEGTVKRLTIENAFLRVDGIDWHDRADALRLIDLSEVEFDGKTGEVTDVKVVEKAAKKLAKEKPHLVKSATSAPNGTPLPGPGSTGNPPGNPASQQQKSEQELMAKYGIRR